VLEDPKLMDRVFDSWVVAAGKGTLVLSEETCVSFCRTEVCDVIGYSKHKTAICLCTVRYTKNPKRGM